MFVQLVTSQRYDDEGTVHKETLLLIVTRTNRVYVLYSEIIVLVSNQSLFSLPLSPSFLPYFLPNSPLLTPLSSPRRL